MDARSDPEHPDTGVTSGDGGTKGAAGAAGRVVLVTQAYPPEQGGNASRIHDTAEHLAGDGWDVTVLAPPASYPFEEYERTWRRHQRYEEDGVDVHRLWTWQPTHRDPGVLARLPYFLLFAVHAVLWLLGHRREYDALVTSTPPIFTGVPGLVGSLLGVPWVIDVRDRWIENSVALGYISEGGVAERAARLLQRTALRRADRVSVTTAALGESLAESYGGDIGEKLVVVPNGVDMTTFSPDDRPEEPVIVYTGNLGRAQDLETVIEAMEHVEADVTLRLVGSGDAEEDLRALAAERGVDDRVEFVGLVPRAEVPGYLNAARVAVAPIKSTAELEYAMPSKVYEYLACALPTVLLGRGEVERFAAEAEGCVHVDNDPEAVAAAFDDLFRDGPERERLGRDGRAYVTEHYSRESIARTLGAELGGLVVAA
jgi:glycosyltransferase involved in cell wall biosynthesis